MGAQFRSCRKSSSPIAQLFRIHACIEELEGSIYWYFVASYKFIIESEVLLLSS